MWILIWFLSKYTTTSQRAVVIPNIPDGYTVYHALTDEASNGAMIIAKRSLPTRMGSRHANNLISDLTILSACIRCAGDVLWWCATICAWCDEWSRQKIDNTPWNGCYSDGKGRELEQMPAGAPVPIGNSTSENCSNIRATTHVHATLVADEMCRIGSDRRYLHCLTICTLSLSEL